VGAAIARTAPAARMRFVSLVMPGRVARIVLYSLKERWLPA
jgi:hypothetical protein